MVTICSLGFPSSFSTRFSFILANACYRDRVEMTWAIPCHCGLIISGKALETSSGIIFNPAHLNV